MRRRDAQATHLVVLLHGIMGGPTNLAALTAALEGGVPDLLVWTPTCYQLAASFDGVEVCAARVLAELRALVREHASLRRISLVGYSFGGLVARFLAGALYLEDWLTLRPAQYVSFATPHVGPLLPDSPCRLAALRTLGGLSGLQMALADEEQLLLLMATPGSVFMRALAAFERRATYANAANDRTVPFWTSFISEWSGDQPLGPPGALAEPHADYPHVEWEGSTADAASGGEEVEDSLQPAHHAQLALLSPLALVIVPLWLLIAPSALLLLGISKQHTMNAASLSAALRDVDGEDWAQVRPRLLQRLGPAGVQPWMAAQLNKVSWHKVSVRFLLSIEGLGALHTHGLLVVRRRGNEAGRDVLLHLSRSFREIDVRD